MKCIAVVFLLIGLNLKAADSKVIRVGVSPAITSAGLYLAKEKSYFAEENLNVELIVFNNSAAPMTLLLAKGEIEVGAGNLTAGLFTAINKGNKMKIVADKGHVANDREYISLLLRKELVESGKFKTLKDLKGLKVSLTSLDGSSQQIGLEAILNSVQLKESDIELIKLSYPEAIVAMKTKAVDATVSLDPFITQAKVEGVAVEVASTHDYVPNQQMAAIFYSEKFMLEQPENAKKFMKAYLRGVRLYNESLKKADLWNEVSDLLNKYNKIDNKQIWKEIKPVGLNDDGSISTQSVANDLKWYHSKKFIEKIPAESELYDFSYIEYANKNLAPTEIKKEKIKKKNNVKTKK